MTPRKWKPGLVEEPDSAQEVVPLRRSMPGSSEIVTSESAADADSNVLRWLGVALATFAATIAIGAV
jgi:hypothetical protein